MSSTPLAGQRQVLSEQLEEKIKNKTTIYEVMKEVNSFYSDLPEEIRENGSGELPKLKHWKRWEWYMSGRQGPAGEFVNVNKMMFKKFLQDQRRTKAIAGDWESVGPMMSPYSNNAAVPGSFGDSYANGTGRIDRIAFHPSNGNIFYLATPAGGLWKTTDGGSTWTAVSDYLASIGISGIVVDWNNPSNIYVLTGTADNSTNSFVTLFGYRRASVGVLKSTDAGATWNTVGAFPLSAGVTEYYGFTLVQNPIFYNSIHAVTTDGIFKSVNGGASWVKTKNGLHYDLLFKPGQTDRVYCTDNTGIYYSNSSGNAGTWVNSSFNVAPGEDGRKALAVTADNTNVVYALCGGATGVGSFSGLYKSTDSGVNFTRMSNTPNVLGYECNGQDDLDQASYDLAIAINPLDDTELLTAGVNLWKSSNSGSTLSNNTMWYESQCNASYIHPDVHDLEFNPVNNKLYACTDGGIYESTDSGTTWTDISAGLDVSQFYHMTQYSDNTYKLMGGLQDNGVKYRPIADENFIHMYGADGFDASFVAGNPNEYYYTINDSARKGFYPAGTSLSITPPGTSNFFMLVQAHPTDPNIVFVGTQDIYKSTNGGNSWSNKGASGTWTMAFAPDLPSRMYSAGYISYRANSLGDIYTSSNSGDTWTSASGTGFPDPANWSKITDIGVNPALDNEVYCTFGGFNSGTKVYYSSNHGANWSNFTYNLPNIPINCVTVGADRLYVGTDNGVYRRSFNTTTWVNVSDNLPNVPVTDIYLDQDLGKMWISTFGRGVWQLDYCKADVNVSTVQEGVIEYKVSNTITATSEIPGTAVNDIRMVADNIIDLKPGFHAKQGSTFVAENNPCNNTMIPFHDNKGDSGTHVDKK